MRGDAGRTAGLARDIGADKHARGTLHRGRRAGAGRGAQHASGQPRLHVAQHVERTEPLGRPRVQELPHSAHRQRQDGQQPHKRHGGRHGGQPLVPLRRPSGLSVLHRHRALRERHRHHEPPRQGDEPQGAAALGRVADDGRRPCDAGLVDTARPGDDRGVLRARTARRHHLQDCRRPRRRHLGALEQGSLHSGRQASRRRGRVHPPDGERQQHLAGLGGRARGLLQRHHRRRRLHDHPRHRLRHHGAEPHHHGPSAGGVRQRPSAGLRRGHRRHGRSVAADAEAGRRHSLDTRRRRGLCVGAERRLRALLPQPGHGHHLQGRHPGGDRCPRTPVQIPDCGRDARHMLGLSALRQAV